MIGFRSLLAVGLLAAPLSAAEPARDAELVGKIAKFVDQQISLQWLSQGAKPAPLADDAEFCRRAYLDLVGRIPKVAEARAFEADPSPTKRLKLVEGLMTKPSFNSHMASAFRAAWLPESLTNFETIYLGQQYEDWLRRQIAKNASLDEIVKATLTTPVFLGQRGIIAQRPNGAIQQYDADQQALQSFYQALQIKPENLGSSVTRAFLGIKLECAQCHDHPFAPYSREQFWQFAAFFGEFTPLPPTGPNFVGPQEPQSDKNVLTIPISGKGVSAHFLDGTAPEWSVKRTPREELANWLIAKDNPFFARNMANRLWAHLFGLGLIDPLDEPGEKNPPSHPELLDGLAKLLVEANYDMRLVLRGLTASRAYQLTSTLTHPSQAEPRLYARMNMKGLTPNQIYDSFATATGLRTFQPRGQYYGNANQGRGIFTTLFPNPAKPTQTDSSILQALMFMNSKIIADQTHTDKSELLAAVIDAPFLDHSQKVEALFFAVFTRKPTLEESERLTSYVDRGGPSGDSKKALADVFWVLLNSPEFLFNH
jgi:hypothetical protein